MRENNCQGILLFMAISHPLDETFYSHINQYPHKSPFICPKIIFQGVALFKAIATPLSDTSVF